MDSIDTFDWIQLISFGWLIDSFDRILFPHLLILESWWHFWSYSIDSKNPVDLLIGQWTLRILLTVLIGHICLDSIDLSWLIWYNLISSFVNFRILLTFWSYYIDPKDPIDHTKWKSSFFEIWIENSKDFLDIFLFI